MFATHDPTREIGAAWGVTERLRMLLAAADRHTIADRLHRFHETVLTADLPEAQRLADTIDAWWPEILGFLETRITNAGICINARRYLKAGPPPDGAAGHSVAPIARGLSVGTISFPRRSKRDGRELEIGPPERDADDRQPQRDAGHDVRNRQQSGQHQP